MPPPEAENERLRCREAGLRAQNLDLAQRVEDLAARSERALASRRGEQKLELARAVRWSEARVRRAEERSRARAHPST